MEHGDRSSRNMREQCRDFLPMGNEKVPTSRIAQDWSCNSDAQPIGIGLQGSTGPGLFR